MFGKKAGSVINLIFVFYLCTFLLASGIWFYLTASSPSTRTLLNNKFKVNTTFIAFKVVRTFLLLFLLYYYQTLIANHMLL